METLTPPTYPSWFLFLVNNVLHRDQDVGLIIQKMKSVWVSLKQWIDRETYVWHSLTCRLQSMKENTESCLPMTSIHCSKPHSMMQNLFQFWHQQRCEQRDQSLRALDAMLCWQKGDKERVFILEIQLSCRHQSLTEHPLISTSLDPWLGLLQTYNKDLNRT